MYYDLYVIKNTEPWVFWDIYTFSVNIIDLIMIVALIVDRDFLGLNKLKNTIQTFCISSKANQIS
jgi:hypothetical protein